MSITFRRTWYVDGVATAVTSALLSDATGAYGIKRNDTDKVVVADATAMDNPSTGVYEYELDAPDLDTASPEAGVTYTAWIEIVYDGTTYRFEHEATAPEADTAGTAPDYRRLDETPAAGLYTYRDIIDHLVSWSGGIGEEAETRRARSAIQRAYKQIARAYKWKYLKGHHTIWLEEPYETGTVTYTSSSRTVTLADGTFPTNSAYWRMTIGDDTANVHRIASYTDSTHVVLDSKTCPSDDVAAGASYKMWRAVYPLPADFRSISHVHDDNNWWSGGYVPPDEWLGIDRHNRNEGAPWYWTIMGSEDLLGVMAIYISSEPTEDERFDFIYDRHSRRLRYDGCDLYSSGVSGASVTTAAAGSTGAVLAGVSLREDVVGAILRLSDTSATTEPRALGNVDQYSEQRVIVTRTNATTVVVDSEWDYGKLGSKFTISDPIDLPEYMMDAFLARCEANMARLTRDYKAMREQEQYYDYELKNALAANAQQPELGSGDGWKSWQPLGMHAGYEV